MKTPYFKPTRYKHNSGFRCFEIGYCEVGNNCEAIKIEVLGKCSDHLWLSRLYHQITDISLDLTTNGYIRIYSMGGKQLVWDSPFACSTMGIKYNEKA